QINAAATGGLLPDLVFVLDFSCSTGMDRIGRSGRAADRIERETEDFHRRVRSGYLALAARDPRRYRVIDAHRPPDLVQRDVLLAAEEILDAFFAGNRGA
ncbi:MAG: dTMP kinase, partial [Peptococcaceae bacterium]|nr:dTMP kinase [Peptococcaceae bacterium]